MKSRFFENSSGKMTKEKRSTTEKNQQLKMAIVIY